MTVKCVAVDFDSTLAYIDQVEELFQIFTNEGLPREKVVNVFGNLLQTSNFNFQNFMDQISKEISLPVALNSLGRCWDWLDRNLKVYEDSLRFLQNCESKNIRTRILTAGCPRHQGAKLMKAKMPHYAQAIYSQKPENKIHFLKILINQFGAPIAFIDDRTETMDQIRSSGLNEDSVLLFHMIRPNKAKERKRSELYDHQVVSSLAEVKDILFG